MEFHDILVGFIGALLPVIGATVTVSLWLARLQARLDLLEYRTNENRNMIQHKSNRLLDEIDQIVKYLQQKHDFVRRPFLEEDLRN